MASVAELKIEREELVRALADPVRTHEFEGHKTERFGAGDIKARLRALDAEIKAKEVAQGSRGGTARMATATFYDD